MSELKKIGIVDEEFRLATVDELIAEEILDRPMDGNHGEQHPKVADYVSEGIPFIMANDLSGGYINYDTCYFIKKKQADSLRKGFAKPDDVLVTHKATIGRTAIVGNEADPYIMLTPQVTYYRIKNTKALDNRYLRFYFDSEFFQKTLAIWAGAGATRAYLGITGQRKLPIIIPSVTKQRKIAAILAVYDDLIETNKRRIALLEKMAEELYREWFVRMRFPSHQNTRFVKGVPEGWEVARIDSLGKVITGKTPATSVNRYYGGPYPFIKTPDMHGNMFISSTEESLSEEGFRSQPSQTISDNSLCVSCIGTGGIVSITTKTSQTNQQINTVCLQRREDLEWGYFMLRGLRETIRLFGSTGTTMTNLSKGKFSGLRMFKPPKGLRNEFHLLCNPMFSEIRKLAAINEILTQTRDLLLPRLISGKLSVEDLDIQFPPSMQ